MSHMAELKGEPNGKLQSHPAEVPPSSSYATIKAAAKNCTACPLYKRGTQTVFGEGDLHAKILIVGEQPGNDEDLAGHPFVGPAGKILDSALEKAGINRQHVYVTNAVKHFKWTPSDRPTKPRIHQKPNSAETKACKPWLEWEIEKVKPDFILLLGRTAAFSVMGREVSIGKERNKILKTKNGKNAIVSWHPSAILRAPDPAKREELRSQLVSDFKLATGRGARNRQSQKTQGAITP